MLRGLTITSYEGIPFEKAFGTIISERIADFFMLLLIIGVTLILQAEYLLTFFRENKINPLMTLGILLALLAVGILILMFIRRSTHPFMQKIKNFARGLLEGMRSILQMKKKVAFILHTLFIWIMYILMTYVLIFTVPETASLSFGVVMVLFVVGGFTISATNGGIGIFPVAFGAALMLFGISRQGGEALGWITWTTQTIMIVILGGLSFLFLPIYNRKK
ncbi:lysylphosphatidylglycerol synthase transmembrane domain-containing protein [Antarcticibacterium sp. 1MA-6-2]|uniref:lysylphosphatidylglycerol synthase transmembrane domain-containing protein n=1 Tax=Antarcticibacterium sp. 1MA-6-2 TaxID=2908210 RepID=UPI00288356A3|nr:lysylphosphatidylglycerol synthase transmembrane domain-containing protein [Antarcticibacterium sp. 1MA-6-2]